MTEKKSIIYDLFILFLSLLTIAFLAMESLFHLTQEQRTILFYADTGICVVFILDFIKNCIRAENLLSFLKWGWIDLISSIPTIGILRLGRFVRIIRILKVLRGFRSLKKIVQFVMSNRFQSTSVGLIIVVFSFILFSSLAILQFEISPDSNIKTANDAVWWATITLSTVGYGDRYPMTVEGRVLAVFLMFVGIGLFGTAAGMISSWFVSGQDQSKESDEKIDALIKEVQALKETLIEAQTRL